MSWFESIPRRWTYPAIAALLAAGAPIGLAIVRAATGHHAGPAAVARSVRDDLPAFVYVALSTLAVFTACGYIVGRQADALADLSLRDPLTGLLNHRAFVEALEDEVARAGRYRQPLSLIVADLDRLKAINDRGGHSAGNLALRTVAGALSEHARRSDLVARIGGDEFALIASHTDGRDAVALAERIRSLVALQGGGLTISVGVAMLDPGRADASALFEAADLALYQAKRQGRNRVASAASS